MDIWVVASPHGLHYEHAKAALDAGAHVLCEKPFTVKPEHAWELVELAERADYTSWSASGGNHLPRDVREAKRPTDDYGIGSVEQSSLQMASACCELLANLGDYPARRPRVGS